MKTRMVSKLTGTTRKPRKSKGMIELERVVQRMVRRVLEELPPTVWRALQAADPLADLVRRDSAAAGKVLAGGVLAVADRGPRKDRKQFLHAATRKR